MAGERWEFFFNFFTNSPPDFTVRKHYKTFLYSVEGRGLLLFCPLRPQICLDSCQILCLRSLSNKHVHVLEQELVILTAVLTRKIQLRIVVRTPHHQSHLHPSLRDERENAIRSTF